MENLNEMEQRSLVDELTQGRELANQLKNQIGPLPSKETCEFLLQKILSSYDKALSRLNLTELLPIVESPESSTGFSPKIGRARDHSPTGVFKKRKTLPRWSEQIKVCSGTGLDGPLNDGHSWRKYGQKDILGSTHPRAYYRCTHKHTRGCVATKHIQKTEDDPLIFEAVYRGKHTCMDVPNSPSPVISLEDNKSANITNNVPQQPEPVAKQKQNMPFNFGQVLKAETEDVNPKMARRISSFSFPSTSIQYDHQDIWEQLEENDILARLISPATSESNYVSGSTYQVFPYPYGIGSDMLDIISTPTSGINSHSDLDMDPVGVNIESNLPFEILDYFTTSV